MQFKYKTQELIDKGIDFSAIFPEKQNVVKEMTGFDFDFSSIVSFLRTATDGFTKQNPVALDIDSEIYATYLVWESKKPIPKPETKPEPAKPSKESLILQLNVLEKMLKKAPSAILKLQIKALEKMKEKYWDGGKIYAGGGTLEAGKSFTISEMKELLNKKFEYSFGFEVWPLKKGTRCEPEMDLYKGKKINYQGLKDADIGSELSFPLYKRDHAINYEINQGQENTYFYFLLEDEKSDGFVGHFGFKDRGDVSSDYVTGFLVFLQEQYGLPFGVEHSVYSRGGFLYFVEKEGGSKDMRDTMMSAKNLKELKEKVIAKYGTAAGMSVSRFNSYGGQTPVKLAGGGELKAELSRLNYEYSQTESGSPERLDIIGKINMLKHLNPSLKRGYDDGGDI